MIHSGRQAKPIPHPEEHPCGNHRAARITAILGTLVFTVFLCSSAGDADRSKDVGNTFGEGAYAVFAPADSTAETVMPEDAMAVEDGSVWAYLESVIARLIYGDR